MLWGVGVTAVGMFPTLVFTQTLAHEANPDPDLLYTVPILMAPPSLSLSAFVALTENASDDYSISISPAVHDVSSDVPFDVVLFGRSLGACRMVVMGRWDDVGVPDGNVH